MSGLRSTTPTKSGSASGQLVAKHYPTSLFLKAADHTYVECGTGKKGWGCWGGKTGGKVLRVGNGSTKRADAIAQSNERAGITCYLINGVCHQAANRILLPANILVMGARGYSVSSAMFGVYGRPRGGVFGLCQAPFNQHAGVTGDLPECIGPSVAPTSSKRRAGRSTSRSPGDPSITGGTGGARYRSYLRKVLDLYSESAPIFAAEAPTGSEIEDFHVELFALQVAFCLGKSLGARKAGKLKDIRRSTERSRLQIEEYFGKQEITTAKFVEEFNRETVVFQDAIAGVLSTREYKQLFGLAPGETIILADPDIVEREPRLGR